MKKIFKSRIFIFILGAILFGGIGVVSAYSILASDIGFTPKDSTWKKSNGEDITNVKDAIDELYNKANSSSQLLNEICTYQLEGSYGQKGQVGALYDCEVGPNIHKNFYILTIRDKEVDMIMEKNITQGTSTTTMTWMDAIEYIDNNNLQTIWSNVLDISLPNVQDIANAVGNTSWKMENNEKTDWFCFGTGYNQQCAANSGALKNDTQTLKYRWLFNYTKECENSGCLESTSLSGNEANGYWTQNLIKNDGTQAWRVYRDSAIRNYDISNNQTTGVRPVITVLKLQLN